MHEFRPLAAGRAHFISGRVVACLDLRDHVNILPGEVDLNVVGARGETLLNLVRLHGECRLNFTVRLPPRAAVSFPAAPRDLARVPVAGRRMGAVTITFRRAL